MNNSFGTGYTLPTREDDPETSHAAAAAATIHVSKRQSLVLKQLEAKGAYGATTGELEILTGIDFKSVTPLMSPMREHGWVCTLPGVLRPMQGMKCPTCGAHKRHLDQEVWVLVQYGPKVANP